MNPHDRSYVPSQIPPTRRDGKVLSRIQPVGVDHEVPVILVDTRRLAPIAIRKELG